MVPPPEQSYRFSAKDAEGKEVVKHFCLEVPTGSTVIHHDQRLTNDDGPFLAKQESRSEYTVLGEVRLYNDGQHCDSLYPKMHVTIVSFNGKPRKVEYRP